VSRCLLDTNIISNVTKPVPPEALVYDLEKKLDFGAIRLRRAKMRRSCGSDPARWVRPKL
jgi:hypothetical protein